MTEDWAVYGLGLEHGRVEVVGSNPRWALAFDRLNALLQNSLGDRATVIEHVGSTAVEGLSAKPILDVAVGLAATAVTDEVVAVLEGSGYEFRGDKGDDGGLLFVAYDKRARPAAHIHAVGHGDRQWRQYLVVRDRLRADPAARHRYAETKRSLAKQFPYDRGRYTAAKSDLIAALVEDAPKSVAET